MGKRRADLRDKFFMGFNARALAARHLYCPEKKLWRYDARAWWVKDARICGTNVLWEKTRASKFSKFLKFLKFSKFQNFQNFQKFSREGGWVVPTRGKYTAWRDWVATQLVNNFSHHPPILRITLQKFCVNLILFFGMFLLAQHSTNLIEL